jgi:TatD DNase family protein
MLIDAHAHLDMYEAELASALSELERQRILTLSTSLDPRSYELNRAIARRSDLVVPLFGIHPWNAPQWAGRLDGIGESLDETPMLGEIGLDHMFVEDESLYPAQERVFEFLLGEAGRRDLSVNLHTSGAEQEVLDALDRHGVTRAVVHWYSGPRDVFEALVERGAFFSMGIGVRHHEHVRDLAAAIPDELLLTETDNPGGPKWLTGENGMPGLMLDVLDALAEARGAAPEAIEETVERNFRQFLKSDPRLSKACGPILDGRSAGAS